MRRRFIPPAVRDFTNMLGSLSILGTAPAEMTPEAEVTTREEYR
jgi:hypothetical protein